MTCGCRIRTVFANRTIYTLPGIPFFNCFCCWESTFNGNEVGSLFQSLYLFNSLIDTGDILSFSSITASTSSSVCCKYLFIAVNAVKYYYAHQDFCSITNLFRYKSFLQVPTEAIFLHICHMLYNNSLNFSSLSSPLKLQTA